MVNVMSSCDTEACKEMMRGIKDGVKKFGVPMVGGHVHPDTPYNSLGVAIIGGVEYKPIKYLNMALNYQDWNPYEVGVDSKSFIYLNVQFAF